MTPNPNPSPEEALRHLEVMALNTAQTAPAARKVNECVSLLTAALSQTLPAPGEVERLRAALHQIANVRPIGASCHNNSSCSIMEGIAVNALATVAAANDEGVAEAIKAAANICLEVSGLIGAANGSSIDSALLEAARRIRLLSQGEGK